MPLANNMACVENLIDFNSGGYKVLSRSLNIQVSFTEATLLTPRRHFERAVDDFLSNIVTSCSWGKHVAIRIGSRLDVLWDRKDVRFDQMSGMDVHNFLHMVSSAGGTNSNIACLGKEVDDLMKVDEVADCLI